MKHDMNMNPSDDTALLDLMISDMNNADSLYRPTNFWGIRESAIVQELKSVGLRDFRRRRGSYLSSFGATDLENPLFHYNLKSIKFINNRLVRYIPGYSTLLNGLSRYLSAGITPRAGLTAESSKLLAHAFAAFQASHSKYAKPLGNISESLIGNPEEVIRTEEGRNYTVYFLNYYMQYLFASKFLDFDKVNTYVELGSGCGRQVEILLKLHPNACYMIFDIAPQLYVAEQYLTSVFPESVVSYKSTREFKDLRDLSAGKIYVFGSWQFPLLQDTNIDLFWNAASMQEMEPHVVANYLSYVNNSAEHVFLENLTHGHHIAPKPGQPGVLKKTTHEDYERGLRNFSMVAEQKKITCFGDGTFSTSDPGNIRYPMVSFWERQTPQ